MAKVTNYEFASRIIMATDQGRIDWQPTAQAREFTASFGGKWTLLVSQPMSEQFHAVLTVKDSEGETIIRIVSTEDPRLDDLHEMARRMALKIDDALVDLLSEIDKPKD